MIRPLALLLVVLAALSLFIGDATLALPDGLILWQVRLPRTLLALLVGGALGLSGAVLQGALRNPLADPGAARHHRHRGAGRGDRVLLGLFAALRAGAAGRRSAGRRLGAAFLLGFAGRAPSGPSLILAGVARVGDRRCVARARPHPGAQPVRAGRDHVLADGRAG